MTIEDYANALEATEGSVETSTPENSKPVEQEEVRDPQNLLKLYNATKEENKALKAYKLSVDKVKAKQEAERLKREQQYEALLPLELEKAKEPLVSKISELEKMLEKASKESQTYKKTLEDYKTEQYKSQLRTKLTEKFAKSGGNVSDSSTVDYLLTSYGDKFALNDKGEFATDVDALFKDLKTKAIGQALFLANVGEGSGMEPKQTTTRQPGTKVPRVVTEAEMMNPRKHGFTMKDVLDGNVVLQS
jgi:hypothetical protein